MSRCLNPVHKTCRLICAMWCRWWSRRRALMALRTQESKLMGLMVAGRNAATAAAAAKALSRCLNPVHKTCRLICVMWCRWWSRRALMALRTQESKLMGLTGTHGRLRGLRRGQSGKGWFRRKRRGRNKKRRSRNRHRLWRLPGEKTSRDHVTVSSGWWSYQAGRAEGGGSGTRDELGALHSALREQAPPTGPIQLVHSPLIVSWRIGEHLFVEMEGAPIDSGGGTSS